MVRELPCLLTHSFIHLFKQSTLTTRMYRRIVREGQLEAFRETMQFVKSVGPFEHMPAEQLEQLCRVLRPVLVGAGEVVQRQGGAAQGMYIVRWGRLVEERSLLLHQGDRCVHALHVPAVCAPHVHRMCICRCMCGAAPHVHVCHGEFTQRLGIDGRVN